VIRLSRTLHFNAGRSLWRRDWSEKKNREVYGDEGPHGFGHNFRLDVSVEGPLDPESAMVINLTDLDRILKEEVDGPLDHRNLNQDVPEFASVSPTAENLAVWIWRRMEKRIEREGWKCQLAGLHLQVTPDFAVEIEA